MSTHTLHFDFNHVSGYENKTLYLKIRGSIAPIELHTEKTLQDAAKENLVCKHLLSENPTALTHFIQVPQKHFHKDCLTMIEVVGEYDPHDGDNHLPDLYHMSYKANNEDHNAYMKRLCEKHGASVQSHILHAYGVETKVSNSDVHNLMMDEFNVLGPLDVAKTLSGQHPSVMSNKPMTFQAMMNEHVYPLQKSDPDSIRQINNVTLLKNSIQSQGPATKTSGYARIVQPVNPDTNKGMTYEFDIDKRKAGDPLLTYELTSETESWLAAAAAQPVQTSRNDTQFQNQTWSVDQGQASYNKANTETQVPTHKATREAFMLQELAVTKPGGIWTVAPNTSTHGITADQGSITFDDQNNFSIDIGNNFSRIVGAYVEFYTDTEFKKPIKNPTGWKPVSIPSIFETDEKKFLEMISNVNTIMGIPMPTDPTKMDFVWPDDAKSAKLLFGGIGTYNYDKNIVWPGFIETGIFNFGIPIFFMVAGAAVTSSTWYKEFIKDTNNIAAAAGVGFSGGSVAFGGYAAVKGLKKALWTFGGLIAGIIIKKGFELILKQIMLKITAAEIANAIPYVGIATRIASIALDAAQLAVSLGEVLSSPAVIEIEVKRQMTLDFTLHPDPKHGVSGQPQTAIWPAVGDNYRILVNYKNGTGFEAKGQVPLTSQGGSSNQAIVEDFIVPWGGSFQITAGIYSKNGWLCGKYQSDWIEAQPDTVASGKKTCTGNITELLVPLTQDTQYNFMQKMIFDTTDNKHKWWGTSEGATIPSETLSSLNPSNTGNNIAQLTGLTINRSAYMIGYGWQASGENIPLEDGPIDSGQMFVFQNLGVLQDPDSIKLKGGTDLNIAKFPSFGFKTKPGIAYDLYGGTATEIGELNFVLDTKGGDIGYLRHVDLLNSKSDFDLDSGLSYGTFTLGDIDAMVVHPNGYIVAVNYSSHRMQILKLPKTAVPDSDSPAAVVVSNKGIQEGLMLGPIALSIAPDGKIMVLESISERVQAFDIKGNPAPTFTGEQLFTITGGASMAAELDKKVAPAQLIQSFLDNNSAHLFDLDRSLVSVLDAAKLDDTIVNAFSDHMIYFAYERNQNGSIDTSSKDSTKVTVITAGSQWNITDPTRDNTYILTLSGGKISVNDQFNKTQVIILVKNNSWQLKDLAGAKSYLIEKSGNDLVVSEYLSYFPINPNNEKLTYCDVAIESKGYLYVLAFIGDASQGTISSDAYVMDVYTPEGKHLFRTPDQKLSGATNMQHIAAGKLAIDTFRNLFTLNFEKLSGPNGRTEPSISQWIPTPPLFELDLGDAKTFDSGDLTNIGNLLAPHGITLSSSATIETLKKGEHWTIDDIGNNKTYDIVTTITNLEVYNIPS
ncbi:hypothetical protein ACU8DI_05180 [Psychroserpens sp. BH13MA-6]